MKKPILILLIIIIAQITFGQSDIEDKYLQAILYLKTNKDINKVLSKSKHIGYHYDKKKETVDFKISTRVFFMGVHDFEKELVDRKLIEDFLVGESELYYKNYYFDTDTIKYLGEILPKTDSELCLFFSKPVGNYLLAELMLCNLKYSYKLKMGTVYQLLFIFDEGGLIKEVLYTSSHYW